VGPERESYFAAAFAASLDAIFVIDDDRYIVDANPAANELLHIGRTTRDRAVAWMTSHRR